MHLKRIRHASNIGYADGISIIDELLRGHWCEEHDLTSALTALDAEHGPSVVAFFQLPYHVKLPEKWLPIASDGEPKFLFRLTGSVYNTVNPALAFSISPRDGLSDIEKFQNACLPTDPFGLLTNTQVVVHFKVWGRRRLWYSKYLQQLRDSETYSQKVLVPANASYAEDHRSLTAATYEVDLANRIYKEVLLIFKPFIRRYSVACQDPDAKAVSKLASFFVMNSEGRIVIRGANESAIAQAAQELEPANYNQNFKALQESLLSKRVHTVYETYLLEAMKQILAGDPTLAIVQCFMILDWFANSLIEEHLISSLQERFPDNEPLRRAITEGFWEERGRLKPSTYDKFKKIFPMFGITVKPSLLERLNAMRSLRNEIVHRKQTERISPALAKGHLQTAFEIVKDSMSQLVTINQ